MDIISKRMSNLYIHEPHSHAHFVCGEGWGQKYMALPVAEITDLFI